MSRPSEAADATAGPVRPAHRLDERALEAFLAPRLPGMVPPLAVRQFEGGQSNPTYLLSDARGQRWVLRKKPPGVLLASAHQVEREARVMQALATVGFPVPWVRLMVDDASVIGTAFYVMDYLDGRVLRDPLLPGHTPADRAAIHDALGETLARLHAVDWRAVGLADFGRPTAYAARQIARWSRQYEAARTHAIPAMDALGQWLADHVPATEEATLAHGDIRIDNLVFRHDEPRVLALLDWELSTIGHPLADLAYACIGYHLPAGGRGLHGMAGADLAALGIPTQAQVIATYAQRTGRDVSDVRFFLPFAFFRLAAIAQGIRAREREGNASSARARDIGDQTELLAEIGLRLAFDPAP